MSVLTDIQARGTEDILINATDNLNGFTDTIRNVFPESRTQVCVVHQIRNACRYVLWKDKKAFTSDMKHIYNAPTQEAARASLEDFARNWEGNVLLCYKKLERPLGGPDSFIRVSPGDSQDHLYYQPDRKSKWEDQEVYQE